MLTSSANNYNRHYKRVDKLGLENTVIEVRQRTLRWLGHAVGKGDDDFVKQAWRFEVEGSRGRGRPRLAWKSMMVNLCRRLGLSLEDAYDSVKWREKKGYVVERSQGPLGKGKDADYNKRILIQSEFPFSQTYHLIIFGFSTKSFVIVCLNEKKCVDYN